MGKTRHHHIEKMIHERTKKKMSGAITTSRMPEWVSKWLETAEELKKEFQAEGLTKSAGYVDDVIAFNKDFNSKTEKKNTNEESYQFSNGWTAKREYGIVMSPQQKVEILAMGKWVLRDNKGVVVDVDKYRNDMFERHDECAMFDMNHLQPA